MFRCNYRFTSVRPEDYNTHDFNRGDCTTRAMTYCLNGSMTYKQIEDEQYRLAVVYHTRRNTIGTWDKVLTKRGYSWIQLDAAKSLGMVGDILKDFENPIVTLSRTHASIIHKGDLVDIWDCRKVRVFGLLVRKEDIEKVIVCLSISGIGAKKVDRPEYAKHRRRRFGWYA